MRRHRALRTRASRRRRRLQDALIALLLLAAGPGWAGDSGDGGAGETGGSPAERLQALCMVDPASSEAYCDCATRVTGDTLSPEELEVMAFAMERTVWAGSEDVMEDAKTAFGLSEAELITVWRNIAAAGLRSSEACRQLR